MLEMGSNNVSSFGEFFVAALELRIRQFCPDIGGAEFWCAVKTRAALCTNNRG